MAKLRQKRFYKCDTWGIAEGSQRGRTGVANSGLQVFVHCLPLILRHLRYPCDTLATGGVSQNKCCVPTLIGRFWHLRYLFSFFYFLAQEKNFCPLGCRKLNCVKNVIEIDYA